MSNIKTLIEAGFIVEPEAVEIIESMKAEEIEIIKNAMNMAGRFIISKKDINEFLFSPCPFRGLYHNSQQNMNLGVAPISVQPPASSIHQSPSHAQSDATTDTTTLYSVEIIKSFDRGQEKGGQINVSDYAKRFLDRLQAIQKMLVQKIELKDMVSISNASGKSVVIGIVLKKDAGFFELEDQTGTIRILCQKEMLEKIELDDIIAVKGIVGQDRFMRCEEIIFPDIPLTRPRTTKEPMKIAFVDEHHESSAPVKIIWNEDECRCISPEKTMILSDPCMLSINGINVLYYSATSNPTDILKRRFIALKKGDFIIDPVPDIFLSRGLPKPMNYKSVSIVPLNYEIDLGTREVIANSSAEIL